MGAQSVGHLHSNRGCVPRRSGHLPQSSKHVRSLTAPASVCHSRSSRRADACKSADREDHGKLLQAYQNMSESNNGRATGVGEPTRESRLPPPRPSPRTAASHSLLSSGSSDDVRLKAKSVAPSVVGHDSAAVQGSMSMPPPPRRLTSASNRPLSMASIDEDMTALAGGAARNGNGNDIAVTDDPSAPVAGSNVSIKIARSEGEGSSRISLSSLLSLRSAQGTSVAAEGSAAPSSLQSNTTEYSSGVRRAASPTLSNKGDCSSGPTTATNPISVATNTQPPTAGVSCHADALCPC